MPVTPSDYERKDHVTKLSYLAARPSVALRTLHVFTITAGIHARSLANFYGQYADRHMNLNSCDASARESRQFDNLLS